MLPQKQKEESVSVLVKFLSLLLTANLKLYVKQSENLVKVFFCFILLFIFIALQRGLTVLWENRQSSPVTRVGTAATPK